MFNKLEDLIEDAGDITGDLTKKLFDKGEYVIELVGYDIEDAVEATVDVLDYFKNVVENPETFPTVLGLAQTSSQA